MNKICMYEDNKNYIFILSLSLSFLFYRAFNDYLFYLGWFFQILLVSVVFLSIMKRAKITPITIKVSFLSLLWLIFVFYLSLNYVYQTHHMKILIVTLWYTITSLFIIEYLESKEINLRNLSNLLLFLWGGVNIVFLILFFLGIYIPEKRDFSGVFHDRNVYSISSVLIIIFNISTSKLVGRNSVLNKFIIFLLLLSVLISKSVTGLVGVLIVFAMVYKSRSLIGKVSILLLFCLIVSLFFSFDNPIKERLLRFMLVFNSGYSELNVNESAYLRVYLLESGWALFKENFLYGIGLDSARFYVFWPSDGRGTFLHNNYLEIAASGGFIVFMLHFFPMFFIFYSLIINRKKIDNTKSRFYWEFSFYIILYRILYSFTWQDYFEFGMVLFYILAFYSYFKFKSHL